MIGAFLGVALASAPVGVRVEVSEDVVVDWTRLVVTVDTVGQRRGTEGTRAVEELARRAVDAGVRLGAGRIRVDRDETVAELLAGPLAEPIRARMASWVVGEVTYFASGRVGLHAELSLVDLLKPWTVDRAEVEPADPRPLPGPWTGLLIDARGLEVVPGWAPRLVDVVGDVLHDGAFWEEAAVNGAAVVYVDDPAHPAATRAGDNPLFLRARAADVCDLVIAPEDVARFRSDGGQAALARQGRLVIVVDR